MARIGGRSLWLAWPAGLVCAGVVGVLAWLALPGLPATFAFVGDTLRAASTRTEAPQPPPLATVALDGSADIDCRDLYPRTLWGELAWAPDAMLMQNRAAPATSVATLVDALQPVVRVTCAWHGPLGSIVSTLAVVDAGAAAVADAALRAQGFACEAFESGVACRRESGGIVEEEAVRDGLWLSSVERQWHPDDYGARLAQSVWG